MFGVGVLELAVIAVAALVLVGPQKLPELLRTFAKFFVHVKRASNEIRSGFDEAIREAELDQISKERQEIQRLTLESIDPTKQILEDPLKSSTKPTPAHPEAVAMDSDKP